MIQENKELLLQYLSAASSYGVICKYDCVTSYDDDVVIKRANSIGELRGIKPVFGGQIGFMVNCDVVNALSDNIKPYLRTISSMTEEEILELYKITYDTWYSDSLYYKNEEWISFRDSIKNNNICFKTCIWLSDIKKVIDWLLKNHFDFMGLIPKGLAITVTKENNPYKE